MVEAVVEVAEDHHQEVEEDNFPVYYKKIQILPKMKKYLYLLISGLTLSVAQAQEITDALRYSQENLTGTARFRAMSGAFGALGGDMSSLNVNPAGSAVFINNQITFTLSNYDKTNDSNYFETRTSQKDNSFDLNQAGGVLVFNNKQNTEWKKFSLALNYENTNNFNNFLFSKGTNPNNSIDSYFLSYANGIPLSTLEDSYYDELSHGEQQAFLGYQGYVINPSVNDRDNTQYVSNVPTGGNYLQENTVYSNGYNGKLSFNAATSYNDKVYIGINLNSHFVDFNQQSSFYERNTNNATTDQLNQMQFDNTLYTYGNGFSFQLGAIAKLTNEFRVGLAYESPTWYKLNDELTQKLYYGINGSNLTSTDDTNPRITNIYAPYKLQTPSKLTGSLAYIFGKSGILSIDYTIKDYSSTKFKPEYDTYFSNLNNFMNTTLNNTGELRIGGEYKIERLSLRAGYRYEESPYKNNTTIGKLNGYSGGLGYNFGSTKADISYAYSKRNSQQGFFNQGFTDSANINNINNTVSLTLLFEL
jgi:hypothetical protein